VGLHGFLAVDHQSVNNKTRRDMYCPKTENECMKDKCVAYDKKKDFIENFGTSKAVYITNVEWCDFFNKPLNKGLKSLEYPTT